MVIVASNTPSNSNSLVKPLAITGLITGTVLLILPVTISLLQNQAPTGSYLSPLPEKQLASAGTDQTISPDLTVEQAILSAQAFLEKAVTLSVKSPQSEDDRQQIVASLNQSLDLANKAVALAPTAPQTYLMRARILASSTNLRSDATILAQKDLEAAQALANGQTVTLPTNINLLELAPQQRAEGAGNLVIAAPAEDETKESTASAGSNTHKLAGMINKGEQSTTLTNSSITADSYIYLIPQTKGQVVYLQSKLDGSAIVATDQITTADLEFEYWIVNP